MDSEAVTGFRIAWVGFVAAEVSASCSVTLPVNPDEFYFAEDTQNLTKTTPVYHTETSSNLAGGVTIERVEAHFSEQKKESSYPDLYQDELLPRLLLLLWRGRS